MPDRKPATSRRPDGYSWPVNFATDPARRHYEGAAGREYHEGKRGVPESAVPWIAAARAELFRDQIQADHSILEFGVGAGWNLLALPGRRRVGHDVSPLVREALEQAGIEFQPETRPLADSAFDRIICHHALEHLLRPADALGEMRRLLRVDGRLLVAVPYEDERRLRQFQPAEPNHHLYSWNPQTLGNLLTECGYAVGQIGLRAYGYDRFAANLAVRWRVGQRGFRLLRSLARALRPLREVFVVATPRPSQPTNP
jgi:SAM-dependent methyltransferase